MPRGSRATRPLSSEGGFMARSQRRVAVSVIAVVVIAGLMLVFGARLRARPSRFTDHRLLLGTIVTVTVYAEDEGEALSAIEAAFEEIERIESITSRYRADSEISRLNARGPGEERVDIDRVVARIVGQSMALSEMTDGAFDVTIAPVIDLWPLNEGMRLPDPDDLRDALSLVDYRKARVATHGRAITLPTDMALDLGGVAKGFAATRAIYVMTRAGVESGLVDVGGDVGLFGRPPDGSAWRVGIKHPREEGLIAVLSLDGGSVATSGDYQRYVMIDGVRYHHIIDPGTGYPARGVMSATVVTERGLDADALATAVFVMGAERGMALVERTEGVEAVLVTGEEAVEDVLVSTGLRDRIEMVE